MYQYLIVNEARKRMIFSMTALLCVIFMMCSVVEVQGKQVDRNQGELRLLYVDSGSREKAVEGAEFTVYKVAGLQVEVKDAGISMKSTPILQDEEGDSIEVRSDSDLSEIVIIAEAQYKTDAFNSDDVFRVKTDQEGRAVIEGLSDGIYLVTETKAAENHLCSVPFLFSVPYTSESCEAPLAYTVYAEPKAQPCGKLTITKKVEGNLGEKDREFHFKVYFDHEGTFSYEKSDRTDGKVQSGDTFTLKHGQSILIEGLPIGINYRIEEIESDQNGYTTSASRSQGRIDYESDNHVQFINRRYGSNGSDPPYVKTGDVSDTVLWIMTGAASLLAIIRILFFRRRYEGDEK